MTELNKGSVGGDVFIREDLTRPYSSVTLDVVNASATVVLVIPAGSPMIADAQITAAAQTAGPTTVTSYTMQEARIPVSTTEKVAAYDNGIGIVVNLDALPAADTAGGAYIEADQILSLANLNFVDRKEPAEVEVQIF